MIFLISSLAPFCLYAFFPFGCAGAKMDQDMARRVIAAELEMPEKQIHVENVRDMGGTILAEGSLSVAFVLQQGANGQWHIVKIRRSSDHWETPQEFLSIPNRSSLSRSLETAFLAELHSTH